MRFPLLARLLALNVAFALARPLAAQGITVRVVDALDKPIAYAWVAVDGARARYTDANGDVLIGRGGNRNVWLDVRRLGYTAFKERVQLPDSTFVMPVALQALPNTLTSVQIIAKASLGPLEKTGFYKRALDVQRGAGTALFIGPEELAQRQPSKATDMLQGVRGIDIKRDAGSGKLIAMTRNGSCQMPVLVDGVRSVPTVDAAGNNVQTQRRAFTNFQSIDDVVDGNGIQAIEIYPRGAMVPLELQVPDAACGLIVVWMGGRR